MHLIGHGVSLIPKSGSLHPTSQIFNYPFTPQYIWSISVVTVLFALCPWSLLAKAFNDLGKASAQTSPGLSWSERFR